MTPAPMGDRPARQPRGVRAHAGRRTIQCFPAPHPDELFYSLVARFGDRMAYANERAVSWQLFGASVATAVDFPTRLGYLAAGLPDGHPCTVDRLIDGHTLVPFYAPFLPERRRAALRAEIAGTAAPPACERVRLIMHTIDAPQWLRLCPRCIDDDRTRHGLCYWHRGHQAAGVLVCPIHGCPLALSAVRADRDRGRVVCVSAERAVRLGLVPQGDEVTVFLPILRDIARDVAWLLARGADDLGSESMRPRYQVFLEGQRLAAWTGRVRLTELCDAFIARYPPALLSVLGFTHMVGEDVTRVLVPLFGRVFQDHPRMQHPLLHLLLMRLLAGDPATFVATRTGRAPFGAGPWPCLNPVCPQHRALSIEGCHIGIYRGAGRKVVGTFACPCGFIYSRCGPDHEEGDRFRIGIVKAYGPLWEQALSRLWADDSLTVRDIACQLRTADNTVKRNAARLGLPFPRSTGRIEAPTATWRPRPRPAFARDEAEVARHRSAWLAHTAGREALGTTYLREQASSLHAWLLRHDRVWLLAHSPRKQTARTRVYVDWMTRDAELAEVVGQIAARLKQRSGWPVRVTRAAISRGADPTLAVRYKRSIVERNDRLPLTNAALERVAESPTEFSRRKIRHVAGLYRQEGRCPTVYQFVERAVVKQSWSLVNPEVQAAVADAIRELGAVEADDGMV